MLSELNKLL